MKRDFPWAEEFIYAAFRGTPRPSRFYWVRFGFSGSEWDVGELQSDSSHYCGIWLSRREANLLSSCVGSRRHNVSAASSDQIKMSPKQLLKLFRLIFSELSITSGFHI